MIATHLKQLKFVVPAKQVIQLYLLQELVFQKTNNKLLLCVLIYQIQHQNMFTLIT